MRNRERFTRALGRTAASGLGLMFLPAWLSAALQCVDINSPSITVPSQVTSGVSTNASVAAQSGATFSWSVTGG